MTRDSVEAGKLMHDSMGGDMDAIDAMGVKLSRIIDRLNEWGDLYEAETSPEAAELMRILADVMAMFTVFSTARLYEDAYAKQQEKTDDHP